MRVTVGETGAQFLQRIGAEGREHQQPADFQSALHLAENRRRVADPVQHQVRPDHSERCRFDRQGQRVGGQQRTLLAAQEGQQVAQPRPLFVRNA